MKHHESIVHLRRDPVLRAVIDTVPEPDHTWDRPRPNHFRSLVVAIMNQQISGKAADTILKRFLELFFPPSGAGLSKRTASKKFPKPGDVLAISDEKLRTAGLSGMKVAYIKDIARHVAEGELNFRAMKNWTDEEIIQHLVRVKGIGRWTAEMFLMFSLGRQDVFSYGDLGLRNAMQNLYKLKSNPTPEQAEKIAAAWSPYRTLASRYLWASVDASFKPKKKDASKISKRKK
jgi:DNA-3-methyladenine glycosylase II